MAFIFDLDPRLHYGLLTQLTVLRLKDDNLTTLSILSTEWELRLDLQVQYKLITIERQISLHIHMRE